MQAAALLQGGYLARLAIDLVCIFALVRGVYFYTYRRTDLFLTFFSFNLAIFLIAFVLNSTEMSLGAAFGLFAVFSMIRYRTEGISTTDMTYLFLGIALGLIMAISNLDPAGLGLIGGMLIAFVFMLESGVVGRREQRQEIIYDNVALASAGGGPLLQDIEARTGLTPHRVEVVEIDLVRDVARLALYSRSPVRKS